MKARGQDNIISAVESERKGPLCLLFKGPQCLLFKSSQFLQLAGPRESSGAPLDCMLVQ